MTTASPRINKSLIPRYKGSVVRLVASAVGSDGQGLYEFKASDGGIVKVNPSGASGTFSAGQVWEVIARVRDDEVLDELNSIIFPTPPAFDFDNLDALIQLSHQHPD